MPEQLPDMRPVYSSHVNRIGWQDGTLYVGGQRQGISL